MNQTLRDLARSSPSPSDGSLDPLRTQIAELVHGRASYVPGGRADIQVDGGEDAPPLAIKVVLHAAVRPIGPRVNELRATASVLREDQPDARLALFLVVLPGERPCDPAQLGHHLTGTGFDRVVVGVAAPDGGWHVLDEAGTPSAASDLADAVSSLAEPEGSSALPREEAIPDPPPIRFLLVSDEWQSGKGGISTINRELAIALATAGLDARVVIPEVSPADRADASDHGVCLAAPDPVPGIKGQALLLTKPGFDDEPYQPDVIIGHGRILGPYAYALQHHHYRNARRVHLLHMDPDPQERAREKRSGPSRMLISRDYRAIEKELATGADVVGGVGPQLARAIDGMVRRMASSRPPVFELIPGLRDRGVVSDPPPRRQVLLVGRAHEPLLKGIDLAIAMVKRAIGRLGDSPRDRPLLVIRGIPEEDPDAVKKELDALADPELEIVISRVYTSDECDLEDDLWNSRVVIMPSRSEGFGLAAYEAIAAGVPVLISKESGLAEFLSTYTTDGERTTPREVLPVVGDSPVVIDRWADALCQTLVDPEAAFARAADLREQILRQFSWSKTVAELLQILGYPEQSPPPGGGSATSGIVALARSTASRPVEASATTHMFPSESMSAPKARRTET
jgi:glycosyltransferase involved in cell wall biosynthesis